MNRLTIVIPVFNCERYIGRCLESLVSQTNKEFDVVVIDDGSMDNTYGECLNFQSKLNIQIIKNEKSKGPLLARIEGMKLAETEWISFIDADDWVENNYVKRIMETVSIQKCDLVFFDYNIVKKDREQKPSKWYDAISCIEGKESLIACCEMSMCLFAVKKSLLQYFEGENIRHGEDALIVHYIIAACEHVVVIRDAIYNYFWHTNSLSMKVDTRAYKDLVTSYYAIRKIYGDKYTNEVCFLGVKNLVYGAVLNLYKSDEKRKKWVMCSILNEFENIYPNWIENIYLDSMPKYKKFFLLSCHKRCNLFVWAFAKLHTCLLKVLCS